MEATKAPPEQAVDDVIPEWVRAEVEHLDRMFAEKMEDDDA